MVHRRAGYCKLTRPIVCICTVIFVLSSVLHKDYIVIYVDHVLIMQYNGFILRENAFSRSKSIVSMPENSFPIWPCPIPRCECSIAQILSTRLSRGCNCSHSDLSLFPNFFLLIYYTRSSFHIIAVELSGAFNRCRHRCKEPCLSISLCRHLLSQLRMSHS